MAGLDPAIHPLRKILFELAGSRGHDGLCVEGAAPTLTGSTPLQHSGNAEVFVELGPMNAERHQFEVLACRSTRIFQSRIPGQGVAILRPSASVTTNSSAVKATEIGLISPTSISKVLIPRQTPRAGSLARTTAP
jgi:hypothetical protein